MPTNYPTTIDDNTTLPNPGATDDTQGNSGFPHNQQHDNANDAIKALETKLGTTPSTPGAANQFLMSNGGGGTSWQAPHNIPESAVTNLLADLAAKQAIGNYITALSGDISASGPGAAVATLAAIISAGSVGSSTQIPVITYDAKGRITGVTTAAIAGSADATASVKGILKLTGDLGGTANTPLIKRTKRFIIAPYGDTRPADYTCAGASNNDVEINAAIVAANALTNGADVELLDGTFVTSAHIMRLPNVHIYGQGMGHTKITTAPNSAFNIIDMDKAFYDNTNPLVNSIVADMELDGSNLRATSGQSYKCINGGNFSRCKLFRIYAHDSSATGIGDDDFYGCTIDQCIVVNCGYTNVKTITGASWSANVFTYTIPSHGYSVGDQIVITGMVPVLYNGLYNVTTVPDANTITIASSNNSQGLNFTVDPGTATTFGITSDSLIGHNGIGIAWGGLTQEMCLVTNSVCIGNQNNNFLIEADYTGTGDCAFEAFTNCVSLNGGNTGYRNTGSLNAQFNNCFDFGSRIGCYMASVTQSKTITAASWSGGVVTFTTSAAHGYSVGQRVEIKGMTPTGYNGYYYIESTPTSTTFTVNIAADPGTATVFGTSTFEVHPIDGSSANNLLCVANIDYGVQVTNDGVQINNPVVEGCYNYGMQFTTSKSSALGVRVHDCGRTGVRLVVGSGAYKPMDRFKLTGQIYNNGKRFASNDGVEVSPSSTGALSNITIDVDAWDEQDTKTQRYGVILRSGGTLTNIKVGGNLTGNLTGPILVQNTGDTIYVDNVVGVNPNGKADLGNITGAVTIDAKLANSFYATLTGNITPTFATTNVLKGTIIRLIFTQDATGGRTITKPSNTKLVGGAFSPSAGANAVDTWTLVFDGTNWRELSRALNLS